MFPLLEDKSIEGLHTLTPSNTIRTITLDMLSSELDIVKHLLRKFPPREKKFDIYFNSLYCVSAIENTKMEYDCIRYC